MENRNWKMGGPIEGEAQLQGAGEAKRKDNAGALSSLRIAEEEGFTTEDTESKEKGRAGTAKVGG
jgi:hypothetical protein